MNPNFQQINLGSKHYPTLLAQIADPPQTLYARGNLEILKKQNALAVVGTRKATAYGLNITDKFCQELAKMGLVIISGLARGIDACAHRAALKVGGLTIAVMGLGLDKIYPPEHKQLAEDIVARGGLLLSEYPAGKPGFKFQFAKRNRIIAGLSKAILVTEAPADSGALITASLALDYNREVLAIPGDITKPTSYGTNKLISLGAKMVLDVNDIFEVFSLAPAAQTSKGKTNDNLNEEQKQILKSLAEHGPLTLSQLAENCQLPIETVSRNLTLLELNEAVSAHYDGTYAIK